MPNYSSATKIKKQASAIKKLADSAAKEQRRQLTEKWRVLRQIGAYNTKVAAAQSRLTKSRMREIEKRFKEIQSMRKLVGGKTVRPFTEIFTETKRGAKTKLGFSPHFTFVRTKNKTTFEDGVRRTSKGYIIEKPAGVSRVSVDKKGRLTEYIDGKRKIKSKYRGKDLLKLMDQIDKGNFPFRKNDLLVLHFWGSPNKYVSADESTATFLARYIEQKEATMDIETYRRFISSSYVEIIKFIE